MSGGNPEMRPNEWPIQQSRSNRQRETILRLIFSPTPALISYASSNEKTTRLKT